MKFKDINKKEYDIKISDIDEMEEPYNKNENIVLAFLIVDGKQICVNLERSTWKKIKKEYDRENETIIGWVRTEHSFTPPIKWRVAVLIKDIIQVIAMPSKSYAIKYRPEGANEIKECSVTKTQYDYLQKRLDL